MDDLVERGLLDWRFDGRRLELYNQYDWTTVGPGSGMRGDKTWIVLPLLRGSYTAASDTFDWGERAQKIIIEGEESQTWVYSTPVSSNPNTGLTYNLGQRHKELYVKSSGLTSSTQADIMAQQYIVQGTTRVDELKRTYNVETLHGQPPYSFLPGDYVTAGRTWTNVNGSTEETLVEALNLTWSGQSCTVDITLGRRRDSILKRLSRAATETDNGVRVTSVAGSPSAGAKTKSSPTAATPTVSVATGLNSYGRAYAVATVSEVTRDINGNSLTSGEVRYEVQYRLSSAAGWRSLGTSEARVAQILDLTPDTTYQIRARATFYSSDRYTVYGLSLIHI